MLSTEGSAAKQNINHIGMNPKWDWGSFYAGDFSQEYSQFSLSGINIRGTGLNLNPANFRFSTSAGFTQRTVSGGAQDGSFKRFLFVAKIGYGKEENNFVDFIFLRAKDEINPKLSNQKSFIIISPNGNEVFGIASAQIIRWNSYNIDGAIKIELSRDGGNTFELIADNQPNVGFYQWSVTGPATFQALIKISSKKYPEIFDISNNFFSIGVGAPSTTLNQEDIINPNAIAPQENALFGAKGKISLFDNKVILQIDGAGSIYTKDIRAKKIDLDSITFPKIFYNFIKPRTGTNYDFALSTLFNFNLKFFNAKIGHKQIGPGFQSLGASYLLNDIREYSILNSFNINKIGIILSYFNQRDNLLNQKRFTTTRNIIIAALNGMILPIWNSNLSFNYFQMNNDSKNDTTRTDFNNFSISSNQSFIINPIGFFRNINLNYSFQFSNNSSYLTASPNKNHSLNLSGIFAILNNLNATFASGFISSSLTNKLNAFSHNYSLLFQHSELNNKLISNLTFSSSFAEKSVSFKTNLGSVYKLSIFDNIGISISLLKFISNSKINRKYTEFIGSLNYARTF